MSALRAPDHSTTGLVVCPSIVGVVEPALSPAWSASGTSSSVQQPEGERCQAAVWLWSYASAQHAEGVSPHGSSKAIV